jgi:hypothetical protein
MVTAVAPARFEKEDLLSFSAKQARALTKLTIISREGVPPEVLAFANKKGIDMLNGAEYKIVEDYLFDLKEGSLRLGTSYEESCQTKGGAVMYKEKEIRVVSKSGNETIVPNYPVAPVDSVEMKPGQVQMDAMVVSAFDIVKGKVTMIRAVAKMALLWPPTTYFQVSGFPALQDAVTTIMKNAPEWDEIVKEQRSVKGKMFADIWQRAVLRTDLPSWLLFTSTYVLACIGGVKLVPYKNIKAYQWDANHPLRECFQTMTREAYPTYFEHVKVFFTTMQYIPIIPVQNLKLKQVWAFKPNAVETVKSVKILDAVLGGNKRGMGVITKNINFGPRMNGVWRDLNTYRALIDRAIQLIDDGKPKQSVPAKGKNNSSKEIQAVGLIDVRATPATLNMLLMWLEEKNDKRIQLYIDETVSQAAAGLSGGKADWLTYVRRPGAILVYVDTVGAIPMLQSSGKGSESTQLSAAYALWKKAVGQGKIMCMTTVYCDDFFKDFAVEPWGMSHEMKAIIHNVEKGGVDPETWYKKVQDDSQGAASWWHAPISIYHELGTRFQLPISRVQFSQTVGYMYVDASPPPPAIEGPKKLDGAVEEDEYGLVHGGYEGGDGNSSADQGPGNSVVQGGVMDVDGLFDFVTQG